MNDTFAELRQELIIDHSRRPRNYGELPGHNHMAHGDNPLCGDKITVQVLLKDNIIEDVRFFGQGCGMSTASASAMTEAVKGGTIEHAQQIFERFHHLVVDRTGEATVDELNRLDIIATGARQPMRAKCLTLAWHTLQAALEDENVVHIE